MQILHGKGAQRAWSEVKLMKSRLDTMKRACAACCPSKGTDMTGHMSRSTVSMVMFRYMKEHRVEEHRTRRRT